MNRYFHLYPESDEQQRLRLSLSLIDLHYEPGFTEVIAPFDIQLGEVAEADQMYPASHQELTIRPPIPRDKVELFGLALVRFALSTGRQGTEDVGFIDHTGEGTEVYFDDGQMKLAPAMRLPR